MIAHKPSATLLDSDAAYRRVQADEARFRPWLAAHVLRHNAAIYARFVHFYHALRSLPRRTRRALHRKLATTLAGAALLLALSGAPAALGAQQGGDQVTAVSGVINVDGATCTLVDAITSANTADTGGCTGASAGADEIVLLSSSTHTFTVANNAGTYGSNALPVITSDITIQGNGSTIERTGAVNMRLFEISSGSLTLNDLTIQGGSLDDTSTVMGGAIFISGGALDVNRSTISGSEALSSNGAAYGGAVAGKGGEIIIVDSTISGNEASGNKGSGAGVALINSSGVLTVQNSTISGNTSSTDAGVVGGGTAIYVYQGTASLSIESSTITNNTHTPHIAGEIYNPGGVYNISGSTLHIDATIISGNTGGGVEDCYNFAAGAITNSLIGGGECGGTTPTTLALGPLGDNGGPTYTHALLSTATDAIDEIPKVTAAANGLNAAAAIVCDGTSEDQRGNARAGGEGFGGTACDIGAFEYASAGPVAITLQGLSATVEQAPQAAAAAGLLGTLSLALSSLWLRRRRSSA